MFSDELPLETFCSTNLISTQIKHEIPIRFFIKSQIENVQTYN